MIASLFKNLETKDKLFVNMLISQIGFLSLGVAGFIGASISTLVVLFLVFSGLIAWTNFIAMKQITGGINRFKKYFSDFLEFSTMKTNRIEKVSHPSSDEIGQMLKEINKAVDFFDKKLKDDMKVMGEIVITMDKVEQGIYGCRIHSNTANPMISTLKNTLNKMLETVDTNTTSYG